MSYAPIVLFVYNRLPHTKKTIEALQANNLASESQLVIYSDAAKTPEQTKAVTDVRVYLRTITGFSSVQIIERDVNWGLAASIIDGVSCVCAQYGRAIVLEDDIVTSPHFLAFMNSALDYYHDKREVWHISGWNYPIITEELNSSFLWRMMNCWGWATWSDRWIHFEKNPEKLVKSWSKEKIKSFNVDGFIENWQQIRANYEGKLDTWAIFWYATIFDHNGLCLNPSKSFVQNIGHDGTGQNCGTTMLYTHSELASDLCDFPTNIEESKLALSRIKAFSESMKLSFNQRLLNKLNRFFKGFYG